MSSRPRRASSRPAAVAAAAASAPAATVEATPSKRKGAAAASARKRRRTDKEEEEGQEDTNEETDGDVEEEGESDTPDAPMSDVILPSESTPAKRSTAAAGNSPTSPAFEPQFAQPLLRTKRLEEKNELQELNKRLELYILRQRERDANQGGLNHEIQVNTQHNTQHQHTGWHTKHKMITEEHGRTKGGRGAEVPTNDFPITPNR